MRRLLALALVMTLTVAASGDERKVVRHGRVTMADVVASLPEDAGSVDLGPSPAPGASRLYGRGELEDKLRAAGFETKGLKLPASVRVVTASQRLSPDALAKLATPAIERALPEGVTLVKVEPQHELVTLPGCVVKSVTIPRLPRQKGPAQSTAMLELAVEDDSVKVPVGISVEVSEAAAHAPVSRGGQVEVVIDRGAVHIATTGIAMSDAEVGDSIMVSLVATSRLVRVKVLSKDRAQIVERP